jgi:hypothetical protein
MRESGPIPPISGYPGRCLANPEEYALEALSS